LGARVEIGDENSAVESTVVPPARASILAGGMLDDYRQHGEAPYPVVDGIAVIEITGVLIHRGGWIGQSSGQTSYEGIAAQIEAAANDPSVRGLAMEIDSFGGEVAGFLTSQTAFVQYAPPNPYGRSWLNTPSRRVMRWQIRQPVA